MEPPNNVVYNIVDSDYEKIGDKPSNIEVTSYWYDASTEQEAYKS